MHKQFASAKLQMSELTATMSASAKELPTTSDKETSMHRCIRISTYYCGG